MTRGEALDLDAPRERWIDDVRQFAAAGRFRGAIRSEPHIPLRDYGVRIVIGTAFGQPLAWQPE